MKIIFYLLLSLLFTVTLQAQSEDNEWAVGFQIAMAKYPLAEGEIVGGKIGYQIPRITVAKYLHAGFSVEGAIAHSFADNTQDYVTLDASLRYDFKTSNKKIVPYLITGISYIWALEGSPTLNAGAGGTIWLNNRFGLTGQAIYKYSPKKFTTQFSHPYLSCGLVYRFNGFSGGARLWD